MMTRLKIIVATRDGPQCKGARSTTPSRKDQTMRRIIAAVLVVGAFVAVPVTAHGDKTKTCSSTTTATSPNDNAVGTPFTTTTTETQTSSCNSNSDTGETTTSTTVNGGGHPK
jgi:hypothetical protein